MLLRLNLQHFEISKKTEKKSKVNVQYSNKEDHFGILVIGSESDALHLRCCREESLFFLSLVREERKMHFFIPFFSFISDASPIPPNKRI